MRAVPVHLDPTLPGWAPLAHAPARYILSRTGRYAHIPRSVAATNHLDRHGRHILAATTWCGQPAPRHPRWADDYEPPRELCGTCHGRALGYDPTAPGIGFHPTRTLRALDGRVWCPGPRRRLDIPTDSHRGALCLLCGHRDKYTIHGSRGYHAGHLAMRRHRLDDNAEALVWCPSCGWKNLTREGDTIRCTTWRCEWATTIGGAS